MSKNVCSIDRGARIVLGIGVLSLVFFLHGAARLFGLIGLVPLGTGMVGYCPLYALLNTGTCPVKTRA